MSEVIQTIRCDDYSMTLYEDGEVVMTKIDDHNVYRFMGDRNWKGSLIDAYLEMFS